MSSQDTFLQNAQGILLVHAVDTPSSFSSLPQWHQLVVEVLKPAIPPLVIFGNKADIGGDSRGPLPIPAVAVLEGSALTGDGLDAVLATLVPAMLATLVAPLRTSRIPVPTGEQL